MYLSHDFDRMFVHECSAGRDQVIKNIERGSVIDQADVPDGQHGSKVVGY